MKTKTKIKKTPYTPGPWSIDGGYPMTEIAQVDGGDFMYRITATPNDVPIDAEGEHNANLMAAAPGLLEALERFIAMVEQDKLLVKNEHREELIATLTQANEAVDDARGCY